MKKTRLIITIALIIAASTIVFFNTKKSNAEICAKCIGSANCRACKNCSHCAHCNSGGSCGVCSYSAPVTKPNPSPKANSTSTTSKSKSSSSTTTAQYEVNSKTLNIRSTPSMNGAIIYTLKYGEKVTILKIIDSKWAKVKFKNIEGYSFRQYLVH